MCVCVCVEFVAVYAQSSRHTLHSCLKFLPPHRGRGLCDCFSHSSFSEMALGGIHSGWGLSSHILVDQAPQQAMTPS